MSELESESESESVSVSASASETEGAEAEEVPYFTDQELRDFCENAKISTEDMYKLVVKFLVNQGHTGAAGKIVNDTGITPGEKLPQIQDSLTIMKTLLFLSLEDALYFFHLRCPWVLSNYRDLLTNLVKLKSMDMIRVGLESEASNFFLHSMKLIFGPNEGFVQQWSEFLQKCKINLDGSIGSVIEQGRQLKAVLNELKPVCDMAVMDDIGKMEDSLVYSFAKMTKRA